MLALVWSFLLSDTMHFAWLFFFFFELGGLAQYNDEFSSLAGIGVDAVVYAASLVDEYMRALLFGLIGLGEDAADYYLGSGEGSSKAAPGRPDRGGRVRSRDAQRFSDRSSRQKRGGSSGGFADSPCFRTWARRTNGNDTAKLATRGC